LARATDNEPRESLSGFVKSADRMACVEFTGRALHLVVAAARYLLLRFSLVLTAALSATLGRGSANARDAVGLC